MELSDKEIKLIEYIRKLGFGRVTIFVVDGIPTHAEETKQSTKF